MAHNQVRSLHIDLVIGSNERDVYAKYIENLPKFFYGKFSVLLRRRHVAFHGVMVIAKSGQLISQLRHPMQSSGDPTSTMRYPFELGVSDTRRTILGQYWMHRPHPLQYSASIWILVIPLPLGFSQYPPAFAQCGRPLLVAPGFCCPLFPAVRQQWLLRVPFAFLLEQIAQQ